MVLQSLFYAICLFVSISTNSSVIWIIVSRTEPRCSYDYQMAVLALLNLMFNAYLGIVHILMYSHWLPRDELFSRLMLWLFLSAFTGQCYTICLLLFNRCRSVEFRLCLHHIKKVIVTWAVLTTICAPCAFIRTPFDESLGGPPFRHSPTNLLVSSSLVRVLYIGCTLIVIVSVLRLTIWLLRPRTQTVTTALSSNVLPDTYDGERELYILAQHNALALCSGVLSLGAFCPSAVFLYLVAFIAQPRQWVTAYSVFESIHFLCSACALPASYIIFWQRVRKADQYCEPSAERAVSLRDQATQMSSQVTSEEHPRFHPPIIHQYGQSLTITNYTSQAANLLVDRKSKRVLIQSQLCHSSLASLNRTMNTLKHSKRRCKSGELLPKSTEKKTAMKNERSLSGGKLDEFTDSMFSFSKTTAILNKYATSMAKQDLKTTTLIGLRDQKRKHNMRTSLSMSFRRRRQNSSEPLNQFRVLSVRRVSRPSEWLSIGAKPSSSAQSTSSLCSVKSRSKSHKSTGSGSSEHQHGRHRRRAQHTSSQPDRSTPHMDRTFVHLANCKRSMSSKQAAGHWRSHRTTSGSAPAAMPMIVITEANLSVSDTNECKKSL